MQPASVGHIWVGSSWDVCPTTIWCDDDTSEPRAVMLESIGDEEEAADIDLSRVEAFRHSRARQHPSPADSGADSDMAECTRKRRRDNPYYAPNVLHHERVAAIKGTMRHKHVTRRTTKPINLERCGQAQAQVGIVVSPDGNVSFQAGFVLPGAHRTAWKRYQIGLSPELPAGLWLMDAGCGRELIDARALVGCPGVDTQPIAFGTANGPIATTQLLRGGCRALESMVEP
jgi:hypothetical protein